MFKKIEEYLKKQQEATKQRQDLRKAQAFYRLVKAGATFIKFVQEDLKKEGNNMNRQQRRRFESELNDKGVLSPELVNYYQQKIDYILYNVNQRLNPPKLHKGNTSSEGVQVRKTPPPEVQK